MLNSWPVVKFGSLYKEPSRNGLTKPKKVRGEGFKFINMGEIFKFDRMDNIPCERAPLNEKEKATSLLEIGDLLFARQSLVLSGAGKCSIFLGDEEEVAFESHLIRVRLDSEKVNPEYVYYYFKSPQGRANMNTIVEQGAGQAGIRGSDLEKLDFPVPPRELQDYIVECITPFDLKLEINQETNQTLEQMAQTLFKSWFVDFDPVFDNALASGMAVNDFPEALQEKAVQRQQVQQQTANGEPSADQKLEAKPLPEDISQLFPSEFEQTDEPTVGINGWIPKGWKAGSLSSIAKFTSERIEGVDLTLENYISTDNMLSNRGGVEKASKLPSVKTTPAFKIGDILVSNIRPYFKKIWFASHNGGRSNDVLGFEALNTDSKEYLLNLLYQDAFFDFMMTTAKGSKMPRGDKKAIMNWGLAIPPSELQEYFSKFIHNYYQVIPIRNKETKSLTNLRDTLLPKLITGELKTS